MENVRDPLLPDKRECRPHWTVLLVGIKHEFPFQRHSQPPLATHYRMLFQCVNQALISGYLPLPKRGLAEILIRRCSSKRIASEIRHTSAHISTDAQHSARVRHPT